MRIKQTFIVNRYIEDFESLALRVHGFDSRFHLNTFVLGLKLELKLEVLSYHPRTVLEAKNHALLHEDRYQDLRRMFGLPNPVSDKSIEPSKL